MTDEIEIASHSGPYRARFDEDALGRLDSAVPADAHFIIDTRVADLNRTGMANILAHRSVLLLTADEHAKSLERMPGYVTHLVSKGLRRDHKLIAIGGGVIQDITCFLSATMLRGVAWHFYPTTLLAQADSCIGSKSSINCGDAKNILGTFTPPNEVHITTRFLDTLDPRDMRSGLGEILKIHAIDGPDSFTRVAKDYPRLLSDRATLVAYIRRALEIKKPFIEEDEFDLARRNVLNYGHSFGHAIESATDFVVPHGIGVTMGMDMANFVAARLGLADIAHFQSMHSTLAANFTGYEDHAVPLEPLLSALSKDKKNRGVGDVSLILPGRDGVVGKHRVPVDPVFRAACSDYLAKGRRE